MAKRREPSGASSSTPNSTQDQDQDQDSIESEFSGDREGQTTYRVRCQKCEHKPPMHTEYRLPGHDTMRFLAFIVAMQTYYSGKRKRPPAPRPSGLPDYFARLEDFLSPIPSTPRGLQGTGITLPTGNPPIAPPILKARPP